MNNDFPDHLSKYHRASRMSFRQTRRHSFHQYLANRNLACGMSLWLLLTILPFVNARAESVDAEKLKQERMERATAVLEGPMPANPARLSSMQEMLKELNYRDDVAAVIEVMEHEMLLRVFALPSRPAKSLTQKIHERHLQTPSRAELRKRLFKETIKAEIPNFEISDTAGPRRPRPSYDGGAWVLTIAADKDWLSVPVQFKYGAPAGMLVAIKADLILTPLRGDIPIRLRADNTSRMDKIYKGSNETFWMPATVRGVTREQLFRAIRGIGDGRYRLETNVTVVDVIASASQDRHAPSVRICRDDCEAAEAADPIEAPKAKPTLALRDTADACIARAQLANAAPEPALPENSPILLASPSSPMVTKIRNQYVPTNLTYLFATEALLSELGYKKDARIVSNLAHRWIVWKFLGKRPPDGVLANFIATGGPTTAELRNLHACVLAHAVKLELITNTDAISKRTVRIAPAFEYRGGAVWGLHSQTGSYALVVASDVPAELSSMELIVRLAHTGEGAPITLRAKCKCSNKREYFTALMAGADAERPISADALNGVLRGVEQGRYRADIEVSKLAFVWKERWTGRYDGLKPEEVELRYHFENDGPPSSVRVGVDMEKDARAIIENSDCNQKGSCLQPRTGGGLSNPLSWIYIMLAVSFVIPFMFIRRIRNGRIVFQLVYLHYWGLVLLAAVLATLFPIRDGANSLAGIFSFPIALILGLPWSMLFLHMDVKLAYFRPDEGFVITSWLGVWLNQLILGFLALWPRKRRIETKP